MGGMAPMASPLNFVSGEDTKKYGVLGSLTPENPKFPHLPEAPQMKSAPAQVAAGIYSGAIKPAADFMMSPAGIASVGVGGLPATAQKVITAAFSPVAFKGMEEARQRANEVAKDPNATLQQKVEPIAESVSQGLMGVGAAKHAIPAPELGKLGVAPVGRKSKSQPLGVDDAISHITETAKTIKGDSYSSEEKALESMKKVSPAMKKLLSDKKASSDGGHEHNVSYDPDTKTWIKMTVPGRYGSGMRDTPAEYLANLKRLDELSGGSLGYQVLGVAKTDKDLPPSIFTRANHIEGDHPKTQTDANESLMRFGFKKASPDSGNSTVQDWITPDGNNTISDLHLQNIVLSPHPEHGTIPVVIDGWVNPN